MKYPSLQIIGLMSGTSLDGLDMAACTFSESGGKWNYSVEAAHAVDYSEDFRQKLSGLMSVSALDLTEADAETGYFFGALVKEFINNNKLKPDYIASHGHTIFHQPAKGFTLQIGHGTCIAAKAGVPVIYDFRSGDVALGGQGAPLVPIGDKLLYSEYSYCLNLGGIANISSDDERGRRVAFDICPVNIVLNALAGLMGKEFDAGGEIARSGKLNEALFRDLEGLSFYRQAGPKSLGREWVDKEVFPLLEKYNISVEDKLCTFCHHIAARIADVCKEEDGHKKVLVTGGGAFNDFLISLLKTKAGNTREIVVPDRQTVMFKEAIVFAFLGYLRILKLNNCLSSVTGASRDSCGGVVCEP